MNSRRNILVLHTDEHVLSFLGIMGNRQVRTPNIDALANDGGMTFDNAYTCNGVCVPSRCTLMTGRHPVAHGVVQNSMPLPRNEQTLGEIFSDAGYATGYFGKTHFGRNDDDMTGEGWQESFIWHKQYNEYLAAHGVKVHYPEGLEIDSKLRYWKIGTSRIPLEHYFENVIADKAISFIRSRSGGPFLAFVSFNAPHSPFTPPPPYDRMYAPDEMELMPRFEDGLDNKPPGFVRWITQNRKYVSEEELRIYLAHVYGLITLVDDNVGRVVNCLKEQGVYDNTLILFTSDHGDYGTSFGMFGKSWSSRDILMKTPLIWSWPGLRSSPRRIDALVDNTDILPTLLDFAGIPVPAKVQGRSLASLLDGTAETIKDAVFAYNQYEYSGGFQAESMIRAGRWKLVQVNDFKGELYDLKTDPWEINNLIDDDQYRDLVVDLRERLLRLHIQYAGTRFEPAEAHFWEDEVAFYDESAYCGERINRRGPVPAG